MNIQVGHTYLKKISHVNVESFQINKNKKVNKQSGHICII